MCDPPRSWCKWWTSLCWSEISTVSSLIQSAPMGGVVWASRSWGWDQRPSSFSLVWSGLSKAGFTVYIIGSMSMYCMVPPLMYPNLKAHAASPEPISSLCWWQPWRSLFNNNYVRGTVANNNNTPCKTECPKFHKKILNGSGDFYSLLHIITSGLHTPDFFC